MNDAVVFFEALHALATVVAESLAIGFIFFSIAFTGLYFLCKLRDYLKRSGEVES